MKEGRNGGIIAYEGNWLGDETFVSFDKKAVTLLSEQGGDTYLLSSTNMAAAGIARATIRQLGCPTKNALKGWHREYEQRLDLPVGYAGRGPKYSRAQKEAAVEHYLTHDRCIAATMRALGYPRRGTLTAWVCEAFPDARKTIVGRAGRPSYPEAMKQARVIGLCSRQESAQAVADKLGVCRPTLYS